MTTYIFIDASNLFYGGKKLLGWSIDYEKLKKYLETKYQAARLFYFGGVEIHNFPFKYQEMDTVPVRDLEKHLEALLLINKSNNKDIENQNLEKHLSRVRFYSKLEKLGYTLVLKPVKMYRTKDNIKVRKANCDVEMTYTIMRERNAFDTMLLLSGDGDFLPVLKHIRSRNKKVFVLAHSQRTAKEIKQFAGSEFKDFKYLKNHIVFEK